MAKVFNSATGGAVPPSGGGATNYLRADGTWAQPSGGGGSGPVSAIALASDAPANLTTVGAEIIGLRATGLAAGTYHFRFFIFGRAAAAATGLRFGVNFTGTSSRVCAWLSQVGTGTSAVTGAGDGANAAAQIVEGFTARAFSTTVPNLGPTLGVDTANTDVPLIVEGVFVATGSGNLELWHASEVAGSSQVMAGSSLILTRTA